MKIIKRMPLALALSLLLVYACEESSTSPELVPEISTVFIDIDTEQLLREAQPGDEVPQFVQMFNGTANHATATAGNANLITELVAGGEIVWKLGNATGVTITGFEFLVISGENAFEIEGGEMPQQQADGSWKARVSPNLDQDAEIKYNILFKVDGKSYWWDPLLKLSTST